jgi:hypothetical protein
MSRHLPNCAGDDYCGGDCLYDGRPRQLVLSLDVACHMLADIDQIITEHTINPTQFSEAVWWEKLHDAAIGRDYA